MSTHLRHWGAWLPVAELRSYRVRPPTAWQQHQASSSPAPGLQALRLLVDVALGSEGLHLGSAWWLVLRVLSILEGMVERDRALRASQRSLSTTLSDIASPRAGGVGAGASGEAAAPMLATVDASMRIALNGFTAMFAAPAQASAAAGSPRSPRSPRGTTSAPQRRATATSLAAPAAPGAALLAWARSPAGNEAMESVHARSGDLDGDGVVLFTRSLCAVSTQELQPLAGASPRITSLHRLAECLLLNMARIRLVWRRVWAVAAPHFVAAACHEDVEVALVAVNALRQLVSRLLQRAELEQYQWQGLALRPFVDIMRHAGDQNARGMAMQCVQQLLRVRSALLKTHSLSPFVYLPELCDRGGI